jgi:hypothetical protein
MAFEGALVAKLNKRYLELKAFMDAGQLPPKEDPWRWIEGGGWEKKAVENPCAEVAAQFEERAETKKLENALRKDWDSLKNGDKITVFHKGRMGKTNHIVFNRSLYWDSIDSVAQEAFLLRDCSDMMLGFEIRS